MVLDAFLLADAAGVYEGKLFVQGGGITRFNVGPLPATMAPISVVGRFRLDDDSEFDSPHVITIQIFGPSQKPLAEPAKVDFPQVPPARRGDLEDGEERFVQFALGVIGLTFQEGGPHTVELQLDGAVVRRMTFAVVAAGAPS